MYDELTDPSEGVELNVALLVALALRRKNSGAECRNVHGHRSGVSSASVSIYTTQLQTHLSAPIAA